MRTLLVISTLALGMCVGSLRAQDAWGELEAVDQGGADTGPLGESLRLVPIDMRASDGFERVYRLEGVGGGSDGFARRSGAITAVFSQSVYLPAQLGGGVAIPAGTVFYIGDPPDWLRERYILDSSDAEGVQIIAPGPETRIEAGAPVMAIDTSAGARAADRVVTHGPAPIERPSTPWLSDERRARRVSALLSLAAGG